jgi:hypothetical protein
MLVIQITETGRNHLKDEPSTFNHETIYAKDKDEVKEKLIERYGKMPKGRKKVYIDTKSGETKVIGFLHSFWNRDCSHNSKWWFQTDWISIVERKDEPVLIV